MDSTVKWIGGGTALAALAVGAALFAAPSLAPKPANPDRWLKDDIVVSRQSSAAPSPAALMKPAETPFVIKRILPIDGPIKYGEWHWDDKGVPDGPIVVTVDLDARVLSVFKGGYEIGATAVLLGTSEHPTPLGVFPILAKERHNVSEEYGNAPMPWTLRLTGDGVAIHGGAPVEKGWASHGCIGTPNAFVSKLFAIAKPGDKVIITRGKSAGIGSKLV